MIVPKILDQFYSVKSIKIHQNRAIMSNKLIIVSKQKETKVLK